MGRGRYFSFNRYTERATLQTMQHPQNPDDQPIAETPRAEIQQLTRLLADAIQQNDRVAVNDLGNQLSWMQLTHRYFEEAFATVTAVYDYLQEATHPEVMNRTAVLHGHFKRHEAAEKWYGKAIEAFNAAGQKKMEVYAWHNRAYHAYLQENPENYLHYEAEAYRLALMAKMKKEVYLIGFSLGGFLYRTGKQPQAAISMLRTSYQIGLQSGYPDVGKIELFLREIEAL
jgi:tetratricopeptide (TPR) repeat protein